ncbi:iron complex outermembrane recepter protein [Malonomonas rubra DSM 5091]|uniref:Iron complex outermembrane recepter protein n=1 Tax=Malonomonas rubra DSM 5091 TaxID=1122189 RepID=A0A1M6BH90_MALRU|nr:TonB-dependent receptor [Malonomonas rubra]SHI48140.1 iron complex outermembrane recepter protein [Malonomonas rubra DSM 5091]
MPYKSLCIWLLVLLCICQPSFADAAEGLEDFEEVGLTELYGDEELVSIATGSKKPVYKAPAIASVITAQQIAEMGARNINEVLETVPGLHVGLSAINRLDSVYSIRGIHTGFNPQVLLLLNGIPFGPPLTGSHPTLFRMPVTSISRIEVIRGPGSAIYGADAYAGVINIITKDANELESEVGARYGSFDSQDVWLQHNGDLGGWKIGGSFEYQTSDGDSDRRISSDYQTVLLEEGKIPGTNYSLAPGSLNTDYEVYNAMLNAEKGNFNLRLWNWHLNKAGVGAGGSLALDPVGYQDESIYLIDATYNNDSFAPDWSLNFSLNYLYQESDIYLVLNPPGTYPDISQPGLFPFPDGVIGNPSGTSQQTGVELSTSYTGFSGHRLRLSGGSRYYHQDTDEIKNFGYGTNPGTMTDVSDTAYVSVPDKHRALFYLSLQDEWQLAPDWEFTGGLRFDNYSDFGNTLNPRLALVWSTRHNLTTKLLYGRAFRAPSFQELYATQNPVTLGNSELEPETIDTAELAFDYRPTYSLQTVLNLYLYRANGLIEYVSNGDGTKTAQNIRDQEGYGFELEANWDATDKLRLSANYSWQYSVDCDSDKRVSDAPGQQVFISSNWNFLPNWRLYSQLNWIASRHRSDSDTREKVDDYLLVDLSLQRTQIFKRLTVKLSVRNLFDEDAYEPSDGDKISDDYPLEGRSLWCELSYRF